MHAVLGARQNVSLLVRCRETSCCERRSGRGDFRSLSFACRFNTGFIDNNYLLFHKEASPVSPVWGRGDGLIILVVAQSLLQVLDRACKDKACREFEAEFKIEVRFLPSVPPSRGHCHGAVSLIPAQIFLDKVEDVEAEFEHVATEYLEADNDEDMIEDDLE